MKNNLGNTEKGGPVFKDALDRLSNDCNDPGNKWACDGSIDSYPYNAIPESVRGTLERCLNIDDIYTVAHEGRTIDKENIMGDINAMHGRIRAYCGGDIAQEAYVAAALGYAADLATGLSDSNGEKSIAQVSLGDFFIGGATIEEGVHSKSNKYIAGLLDDRNLLRKYEIKGAGAIGNADAGELPCATEWLIPASMLSNNELLKIAETVNLESVLIAGVETLTALDDCHSNSRDMLKKVRYSEQILAPIAEVMGFDALAMALNDRTKQIRLVNGGYSNVIRRARAYRARFEQFNNGEASHGIGYNTQEVFKELAGIVLDKPSGAIEARCPVSYDGDINHAIYGYTNKDTIFLNDEGIAVSWRYRLKSEGSLAWKIYQDSLKRPRHNIDNEYIPAMDVLGITLVVDTKEHQVAVFRKMVENLLCSSDIEPYAAPTKVSPIHIRGSKDYVNELKQGIAIPVDERIENATYGLHLGKFTGMFQGALPFEIQCVTRSTRDQMQTGNLAHIIYKCQSDTPISPKEIDEWSSLLKSIKDRRKTLNQLNLIGDKNKPISYNAPFCDGSIMGFAMQSYTPSCRADDYIDRMVSAKDNVNHAIGSVATLGL